MSAPPPTRVQAADAGPTLAGRDAPPTPLPGASNPLQVRSTSLAVLAVLATLAFFKWAAPVLIPVLLGLMISYALAPVVDRLQRWRLPRAIGAALVMLAIVGALGSTAYALADDASVMLESLPDATRRINQLLRKRAGGPTSAIDKVQQAAQQLEQAARDNASRAASLQSGVTRVIVERPRIDVKDYLWTGTLGFAGFVGQATMVALIAYFLLAAGDSFRRKVVRIAGRR